MKGVVKVMILMVYQIIESMHKNRQEQHLYLVDLTMYYSELLSEYPQIWTHWTICTLIYSL